MEGAAAAAMIGKWEFLGKYATVTDAELLAIAAPISNQPHPQPPL